MPRAKKARTAATGKKFHIEFLTPAQKMAWAGFQQHDVLFLSGPAGCGKTHLAMAFAIKEILDKSRKRIILTRPIVESGEKLGHLPGDVYEKVNPYMLPLYSCMDKLVGLTGPNRESVEKSVIISPLAYMRGVTFENSVCIFDEAQNATKKQLKLFLSRFGENSKIIITGDPQQSDLGESTVDMVEVMKLLETVPGIGIVEFKADSIVRHPLVSKILEKLS